MKNIVERRDGIHVLAIFILLLVCQGFQCQQSKSPPEIYIGGIVRDHETREPVCGIEVCIDKGGQLVKTNEVGKFGFKEVAREKYLLQLRDKRGNVKEKYINIDTILKSKDEKVLADILLRRK